MKIVIDIDDNLYTRLFDNGTIDAVDMLKACATIRKGDVLSNGGLLSWYCSECSTPTAMGTMQYCYHCGAKMEVESETSDRYTRSNVSALQERMGSVPESYTAFGTSFSKERWIPVSERLPEKMGTYLVTLEYKEHGIGVTTLWFHIAEIGWDLRVADKVLAWRPLPEAYKESEEEE